MSESASWFAGSAFDFGFPHYFGSVDNRLDTNHAAVNEQKKKGGYLTSEYAQNADTLSLLFGAIEWLKGCMFNFVV